MVGELSKDVYFPLASNAHSLLTGRGVESVRSRLKIASLLYENVLVHSGQLRIQAGPTGSRTWHTPYDEQGPGRWQSSIARRREQVHPFTISVAPESSPGVRSGPFQPVVHSETTISWDATFDPFRNELSRESSWIEFVYPHEPGAEVKRVADRFTHADESNPELEALLPHHFVPTRVITDVNNDLMVGLGSACDVSVDPFHGRVISARFAQTESLQPTGLALPVLLPRVRSLSWEDIGTVRRIKGLERLREVLREVELEATAGSAAKTDPHDAIRDSFAKRLAIGAADLEGVLSTAGSELIVMTVGAAAGYATMGFGLVGPVAGAAAATAVTAPVHLARVAKRRRDRAWIGVWEKLTEI
jgi:hypothetical protein